MIKFDSRNFSKHLKWDLLFFYFFFIATYFIVSYSISYFPVLEPDSKSYLDNNGGRLAIYPLFLDLFYTKNFFYILLFQKIFFILSLYFLFKAIIDLEINRKLIVIIYLLTVLNIYYTSFSKTILTESLFFSLVNISVAVLLQQRKTKFSSIILGFCLGGMISIKHEGIIISFFLTLIFLCSAQRNKIIFFLFGFIILPYVENYYFFKTNDVRNKQLVRIYFGKIFMLSGTDSFKLNNFDDKIKSYLLEIRKESVKVNKYLKQVKNPLLKANLTSDFEVAGQYQISDKIWKKLNIIVNNNKIYLDDEHLNQREILFNIISKNPFEYLKLSVAHYLSLWTPGSKNIFLDFKDMGKKNKDTHVNELLKKTSSTTYVPHKNILKLNLLFFLSVMILLLVFLFNYSYKLIKHPKKYISFFFLILSVQTHLIFVSTVNVGTPRYLMPVYPLILLIIVFFTNNLICKKKRYFNYFDNVS